MPSSKGMQEINRNTHARLSEIVPTKQMPLKTSSRDEGVNHHYHTRRLISGPTSVPTAPTRGGKGVIGMTTREGQTEEDRISSSTFSRQASRLPDVLYERGRVYVERSRNS